jgi:hypothetical protein
MLPSGGNMQDMGSLPQIGSDTDRWVLAEGDYGGSPLIVRSNVSARPWCGHEALVIKLGFAVPLNEPNPGELPDPVENEQLNTIEDIIIDEVAANAKGVYALTLTTGTMREFIFYIALGADIGAMHLSIRNRITTHHIQCQAVIDRTWDAYTEFASE